MDSVDLISDEALELLYKLDSTDLISDEALELLYKAAETENHAHAIRALFQAGVDAALASSVA